MNILLISPLPPPAGGIASWTKRYFHSPIKKEHNITIINTAILGKRIHDFSKLDILAEIKRNVRIFKQLHQKLQTEKIDIIHLNSPCSKLGLIRDFVVSRMIPSSIPYVVHYRCDVTYMLNNWLSKWLFKKITQSADGIISLNRISQQYIKSQCGCSSVIVPNFISDELFQESFSQREIQQEVKKFLFVGHVNWMKGFDVIHELALKFPQMDFICVGSVDKDIIQSGEPDNLKFIGELTHDKLKEYYLNSDVFLFPTKTEGFPNVIAESMAFGLPIISTPVGAIPDMLEQEGGILVKDDDVEGFISVLEALIPDLEKRKAMSDWNKEKVRLYSIQSVSKQLLEIYADCINKHRK